MIVNGKVHVGIVHYKGHQGHNMRPRESHFLSARKVLLLGGKRFSERFSSQTSAKDKRVIHERFAKVFFLRRMAVSWGADALPLASG